MLNRICSFTICVCTLLAVGCNSTPEGPRTVPAKGTLTLDGAPVSGAAIVFIGSDGTYSASGLSDKNGNFSLNAFEYKTGAVPGTYNAIITRTVEVTSETAGNLNGEEAEHAGSGGQQLGVKNDMPAKYAQPSPSFQFVIPEDGVTDLKLELSSN